MRESPRAPSFDGPGWAPNLLKAQGTFLHDGIIALTKPVHILGISAFYHDSAACPGARRRDRRRGVRGALHPQEGRRRLPGRGGGRICLREAGITATDLDYVGFYDKPLLKFERILETYLGVAPRGFRRS